MIIYNENLDLDSCINNILDTSRMSLAAKGLIIYLLLKKSENYELSIHDLSLAHCCSEAKLEKLIYELQQFGYINYEIVKSDNGLIDGKFTIYDTPHDITMIRYDIKRDLIKSLSKAEKTFINKYLNPGKYYKRVSKTSTLMEEIRSSIVDWDLIFQYINTSLNYNDFLDTEYWRIITQYLKNKYNFTCQHCGKKFNTFSKLNVHHKTYEHHGNEHLEEVQNSDLEVLCEDCHKKAHLLDLSLKAPEIL